MRNIFQIGCDVKYIIDASPVRCAEASSEYPQCIVENAVDYALNDSVIDAVVIVLPVSLHYPIAKQALMAGKHVLVEKPITFTSAEAEELIELANEKNLVLMVDHTYLYSSAVRTIKKLFVERKERVRYFDSTRVNLGKFQHDVNVVWDLAPHDIAILDYLIEERPEKVIATGISYLNKELEDIAYITIHYGSGAIAHLSVSWVSPIKIRNILIGGNNTLIRFNDLEVNNKIEVFDTRFEEESGSINCWIENTGTPELESTETLSIMLQDFVNCINYGGSPVSNSQIGLDVVKILEAAQESMANGGAEAVIQWN